MIQLQTVINKTFSLSLGEHDIFLHWLISNTRYIHKDIFDFIINIIFSQKSELPTID